MERGRADLKEELDEEEADWDEEQSFWELMMFIGPFAITNLGWDDRKIKAQRV